MHNRGRDRIGRRYTGGNQRGTKEGEGNGGIFFFFFLGGWEETGYAVVVVEMNGVGQQRKDRLGGIGSCVGFGVRDKGGLSKFGGVCGGFGDGGLGRVAMALVLVVGVDQQWVLVGRDCGLFW
ncbi:hypothetical protein ACH5RR_012534 [Cinchona calisaya]|uniref:Uncharacterized protein n=1 Tax=Cinchona calisaya TaxID=153742 RepID=A0ABD3A8J3_9GENT